MKNSLRLVLSVSRWRFWAYLAGPYLVGYVAGLPTNGNYADLRFWLALAYFTFPANLYLYGMNDLSDADTDALNPKKGDKEYRLPAAKRKSIARLVTWMLALGIAVAAFQSNWSARLAFAAFLILAAFYSVKPIRLKARPFLDSASNVLYACPFIAGYAQASGGLPPLAVVAAAWLWTSAMHLFSAIPDIESDLAAAVRTTAVVLRLRYSLIACAILWGACCAIIWSNGILAPYSYLAAIYPAIPLLLAIKGDRLSVEKTYWMFPAVNTFAGFIVFYLEATKA